MTTVGVRMTTVGVTVTTVGVTVTTVGVTVEAGALPDGKPLPAFSGIESSSTQFRTENRCPLFLELLYFAALSPASQARRTHFVISSGSSSAGSGIDQ